MAASDASSASVGLRVSARKASTSEQASPSHGSVMDRDAIAVDSAAPGSSVRSVTDVRRRDATDAGPVALSVRG